MKKPRKHFIGSGRAELATEAGLEAHRKLAVESWQRQPPTLAV